MKNKGGTIMKTWKKILYAALAAVLILALLALSACGSFTPRMAIGLQKLNALDSYHTDTAVTADMTVRALGSETPMTLRMNIAGDHQKDPSLNALELSATVFDVTESLMIYVQTEEDKVTVYSSIDGGESWLTRVQVIEKDEAAEEGGSADESGDEKLRTADLLKLSAALSESFEEVGETEIVGGDGEAAKGVRYEGVIPAELLRQVISPDALSEAAAQYELQLPADSSWLTDIPAAVVMDRQNNTIVRIELDLAGVLSGILGQLLQPLLASYDLPEGMFDLTLESFRIETDFSRFDSVSVTLPGEAEQAA